jgi:predicted MFS family arabinose efflux permease
MNLPSGRRNAEGLPGGRCIKEAPAAPLTRAEEPDSRSEPAAPAPDRADDSGKYYCQGWLVNLGWLNTTLALSVSGLPIRFLLKDQLNLDAEELSRFLLLAHIPIYLKPFAGFLSDAVPLFGTRRRHYAILGFLSGGALWLLLGLVPRTFTSLLWTYLALNIFLTLTSTVLGGLMVEVGKRENKTGRLGAQRHAITLLMGMIGGPAGGFLVRQPFLVVSALTAAIYSFVAPIFWLNLREPAGQKADAGPLREVARQARVIARSRTLWAAAAMIVLVVAAPGFGTPLLFYQTDVLKFAPEFIGVLGVVAAAGGVVASWGYTRFCRRYDLRALLAASIVIHGALTLLYLAYRSPVTALLITAIEGATAALAILPLYDLAARATPRGSEALGFCIILSVWNLTTMLSDFAGSWMYTEWSLTFNHLIWINTATTLLVLVAVPFLPRALTDRREGDPERR